MGTKLPYLSGDKGKAQGDSLGVADPRLSTSQLCMPCRVLAAGVIAGR